MGLKMTGHQLLHKKNNKKDTNELRNKKNKNSEADFF